MPAIVPSVFLPDTQSLSDSAINRDTKLGLLLGFPFQLADSPLLPHDEADQAFGHALDWVDLGVNVERHDDGLVKDEPVTRPAIAKNTCRLVIAVPLGELHLSHYAGIQPLALKTCRPRSSFDCGTCLADAPELNDASREYQEPHLRRPRTAPCTASRTRPQPPPSPSITGISSATLVPRPGRLSMCTSAASP